MEIYFYMLAIVCVFIGYFAAKIEFKKKLKSAKTEAFWTGFNDGRDSAYEDAGQVRRAYLYHFENRK